MPANPLAIFPDFPMPLPDDGRAIENWLDDGGSIRPSPATPERRQTRARQPADTVQGCRDRAAADLLASVAMTTANARRKMESSAHSWTARADLLQRLDDSFEARIAAQRLMR